MKETASLLLIIVLLLCGMTFSRPIRESTSVIPPDLSVTRDALRADPVKTRALLDSAVRTYESLWAAYRAGNAPFHELYLASKRCMEIEISLATSKSEARQALANHASRMKERLTQAESFARAGARGNNLHHAHAAVAEAKILLLNAGGSVAE